MIRQILFNHFWIRHLRILKTLPGNHAFSRSLAVVSRNEPEGVLRVVSLVIDELWFNLVHLSDLTQIRDQSFFNDIVLLVIFDFKLFVEVHTRPIKDRQHADMLGYQVQVDYLNHLFGRQEMALLDELENDVFELFLEPI